MTGLETDRRAAIATHRERVLSSTWAQHVVAKRTEDSRARAPSVDEILRVFDATPEQQRDLASLWVERADQVERTAVNTVFKDGKCGYVARRLAFTEEVLLEAFSGSSPALCVGSYLSNKDATLWRCIFDIDKKEKRSQEDTDHRLWLLRRALAKEGIPHLIESSRSGEGYHVELWFDRPVPTWRWRHFAELLLHKYEIPVDERGKPDIEVYPKRNDPLGEGELGVQVARPGALEWFMLTGGSVYLDPVDLRPIPMSRWRETILAAVIPAEVFEAAHEHALEAFPALVRKLDEQACGCVTPHVASDYDGPGSSLNYMQRWLSVMEGRGHFKVLRSLTYADGTKWVVDVCPNWQTHSSHAEGPEGKGGGAFFFFPGRGPRYRCHHDHCRGGQFTWRHARAALDSEKKIRMAPPGKGAVAGEVRETTSWRGAEDVRRAELTEAAQRLELEALSLPPGEERSRVQRCAKRLRDIARCARITVDKVCSGHGSRGKTKVPCDNQLCPYEAQRDLAFGVPYAAKIWGFQYDRWRGMKGRSKRRDFWFSASDDFNDPTVGHVAFQFAPGDFATGYAIRAAIMASFEAIPGCSPRWFLAWDRIVFFWTMQGLTDWCTSGGREVELGLELEVTLRGQTVRSTPLALLTVDQAAEVAGAARQSVPTALNALPIDELVTSPWMRERYHRQGGGLAARRALPWPSISDRRDEEHEAALEENDGVDPSRYCTEPVVDQYGRFRPCGCQLHTRYTHGPTGTVLGGCHHDDYDGSVYRQIVGSLSFQVFEERWARGVLEAHAAHQRE